MSGAPHRIGKEVKRYGMTSKRIGKKIGRNDPCSCGSGKKYKKCCLRALLISMPVTLTNEESRIDELIIGGRSERVRSMVEVVQIVFNRSRQRADWGHGNDSENDAKLDALRIKATHNEIAKCASEILSLCPHSRQYWFQLLRRLAPLLWEELQGISKVEGSPDWFAEVTKGAGHLVLTSSPDGDPWEWVENSEKRGIDYRGLSRREMLVAAQIYALAQLCYEAQVRFRFACKGFRVFAEGNENDALATQDTKSITRYEERRSRYETFSGSAGLWRDPEEIIAVRKDHCHWIGLRTAMANYFVLQSQNPLLEIPLQHLLLPFTDTTAFSLEQAIAINESDESGNAALLIPYDRLIEHPDLRLAFESAFGIESERIVAFLYSVFRFIYTLLGLPRVDFGEDKTIELVWANEPASLREKTLHHWKDVGAMGFLRSSKADWIRSLWTASGYVHDADDSVHALDIEQIEELIDKFTWRAGMPLNSNDPILFIELSSHTLILDGFSAGDFLRNVLLAANLISKDKSSLMHGRDLTGRWLEVQAKTYFTRELCLAPGKVPQGKIVRKKREIDIAFVFNRTLFVIDCKAMAKDAAFMEGQHQRIRNRHSEILEELNKKNLQRIELITKGLLRDVISPESFDHAYSLVCTSAVEYLPLENDVFWSNGVPLVGPPEELLDSIRALSKQ
jgi:hypothetical protein